MERKHKKYVIEQIIWSFFINGILNGLLAFFTNKDEELRALTMSENYVNLIFDIAITGVILAWLIAWSVNSGVKKAGLYATLQPENKFTAWMGKWFRIPARYGWIWCIAVVPVLYGLSVAGMMIFGVTQISLWGWTLYKAAYTGIMGATFSPIFIISAYYSDKANLEPKKKKVKKEGGA